MRLQKRLRTLVIAIALAFSVSVTAYAREVPDLTRTGTVSVRMTYDGNAVAGGTLALYRAGEIQEKDGNYSFVLTEDFAKSGVSLDDPETSAPAAKLAAYVQDNKVRETAAVEIGGDGRAKAEGLALGVYLVVQTKAAEGYEAIEPFVVSIPANDGGVYVYDVDASPKMSVPAKEVPTPDTPEAPTEPALPQTGQLNWPVPVLALAGLCLFLLGWALCFGKKKVPYEA